MNQGSSAVISQLDVCTGRCRLISVAGRKAVHEEMPEITGSISRTL